MTCHSCETLLKDVLSDVKGVKSVKADHKSGKIDVEFDAPASEKGLKAEIESQGYKVS